MLRFLFPLLAATLLAAPAFSITQTVTCISGGGACAIAPQITVELTDLGTQLEVTVTNAGPVDSNIRSLYFDTLVKSFSQIASISGSPGVNFVQGFDPASLPGAGPGVFPVNVPWGVFADPSSDGIGPGESVSVVFDYADKALFWLSLQFATEWRVGIYEDGQDIPASFVTNPIPEPGTLALFGMGALGLALAGRKRAA